ncbi:MAG: T9SS type A sorting domain-containing protein, partial [Candidatus Zixiibacteriota bacterium]
PKTIYNGKTDPDPGDPQTIALDFLNSLKDVYELNDVYQDLEFDQTRITEIDTIILKHVDFQVQIGAYPVFETRISVHMNNEGQIYMVTGRSSRVSLAVDYTQPLLTEDQAIQIALDSIEQPVNLRADSSADLGYLLSEGMHLLCYQIIIPTQDPDHDWLVYVDQSGRVLKKTDLILRATGLANVYLTNPTEGSPIEVSLLHLDGTYYLRGDYSDVYENWEANRAYESDDDFRYGVYSVHFDEANVYYHMDKIQPYLLTKGFAGTFQMKSSVRDYGGAPYYDCANAYYSFVTHETNFGKGCTVPDVGTFNDYAQEAGVIYHEFGHYVEHYQLDTLIRPWNMFKREYHEAVAIAEGIADYFACSLTDDPIHGEWVDANVPSHIRNLDNTLQYSDTTGESHHDGQIIGGATWKTRDWMLSLNEWPHPDMIVIAALAHCEPTSYFQDFWINMVVAGRQIALSDNLYAIDVGFTDRGFIAPENTEPEIIEGPFFVDDPPEIIEGGVYEVKIRAAQIGYPDGVNLDYVWWTSSGGVIGETWPPDTLVDYTALECPGPEPCYDCIHVKVYDGLGGWDQASLGPFEVEKYEPGGGGCPFLYVWNGIKFEEDNTILAACEINPEVTVTDYYMLSRTLVPTNKEYRVQIREFEDQVTYIDRVKLVAVDHTADIKVAVTPEGRIFGYDKELVPTACVDQNGKDYLSKIKRKDGIYFTSEEPGYLIVTYSTRTVWPNVLYDPPPIGPDVALPPWQKRAGIVSHVVVEVQDVLGEWHKVGDLPPRFYPERSYWIVGTGDLELGEEFKVKLSWDPYYAADELKYYIRSKEQPINVWSYPVAAVNFAQGEILKEMLNNDGDYATLMPGETIELSFPVSSHPESGMVRDFILQTAGYYINLKRPTATPSSFALLHNYPNPFNASTVIPYDLPQAADVRLEIFNVMGQRVRLLIDQHQSAGYKNITWDGKDDKGMEVSSGIYFYRLQTKDYSDSKKMVLMR